MGVNMEKNIFVTQPYLPELKEIIPYLEQIWKNKILTNGGPYVRQLETELAEFLGVPFLSLFANGTLALITAIKALGIKGEVITTPYSFVATTHSLWWNNLTPVFVDVDPSTGIILPERIEEAITAATAAILPVHVYGNPCNVEEIQKISVRHNIPVIYDAAHAFGVTVGTKSILHYGDFSILSFHATKCFNTFEGGAVISYDSEAKKRVDNLKNFGFVDEVTIIGAGMNAKMNEFQAAVGLVQLKHFDDALQKRKCIFNMYKDGLSGVPGVHVIDQHETNTPNYSYAPIIINKEEAGMSRDELYALLRANNIYTRRYFYPLISNLEIYKDLPSANITNLPNANRLSNSVICLPMYTELAHTDVEEIIMLVRKLTNERKARQNIEAEGILEM